MSSTFSLRCFVLCSALALLSACGGGGGTSEPANISPVASASVSNSQVKVGYSVNLDASASNDSDGTITQYQWTISSPAAGASLSGSSVTYTPQDVGDYTATLTVTDDRGASASTTVNFSAVANQLPNGSIALSATQLLQGQPITLEATNLSDADGTVDEVSWVIDGVSYTSTTVTLSFSETGDKAVELSITDNDGGVTVINDTFSVVTNQPASASFSVLGDVDIANSIPFTLTANANDADSTIVSVLWDMGDGTEYSNEYSITHTYAEPAAEQIVTLTLTDEFGVASVLTYPLSVDRFFAPVATIDYLAQNQVIGNEITFTTSLSYKTNGEITAYQWDFGDGTSANGDTVTHTYSSAGNYVVNLLITDNHGEQSSDTLTLTVGNGNPPAVYLFSDKNFGTAPLNVTFEASVFDNDSNTFTYLWNFGDGTVQQTTNDSVSYTYQEAGTYQASLTVSDENANEGSDSVTITVNPAEPERYSVTSSASLAAGQIVDSDSNDTNVTNVANNDLNSAQAVGRLGTISGYVTETPTGGGVEGDDNFAFTSDEYDVFFATLSAGQKLLLSISDYTTSNVDLDLFLFDSNGDMVDSSTSLDEFESIQVPADGSYFIAVQAYTAASNYTLIMNYDGPLTQAARFSNDFIVDELVTYEPPQSTQNVAASSTKISDTGTANNKAQTNHGRLSKHYIGASASASASASENTNDNSAKANTFIPPVLQMKGVNANAQSIAKLRTLLELKTLKRNKTYAYVDLNYWLTPLEVPTNDYYNSLTWHYDNINLSQAWTVTQGSVADPAIVAVVDTGVMLAHEDLAANLVSGYDFISSTSSSNDGDGIDNNPDDPGDGEGDVPSSYHGTHVAGTIGAVTNNGKGIAGIGYNVEVMPIRVLGTLGGSSYDIMQGVLYAAGLTNASGTIPAEPADVINLSLGCDNCFSSSAQRVYNDVAATGALIVAAAGNSGNTDYSYPASYDNVFSVAATDFNNNRSPYSQRNDAVDLAAPGGDTSSDANNDGNPDGVLSLFKDEDTGLSDYTYMQGTSMASPHVAGVFALMKSVRPSLTTQQVAVLLRDGYLTNDLNTPGYDTSTGYGLIDAYKAVIAARDYDELGVIDSTLTFSSNTLSFSTYSTYESTFTIGKSGNADISVASIAINGSFITVTSDSVDANGLGSYTVSVADNLPNGDYNGTITVTDSAQRTYTISITLREYTYVSTPSGLLYALLIDVQTDETIVSDFLTVDANGRVNFTMNDVPQGQYYLIFGTDLDNDYIICDEGELCGVYPSSSLPEIIEVNSSDIAVENTLVIPQNALPNAAASSVVGAIKQRGFKRHLN